MMEHGQKLLGALELAGAAVFAAGLALRTARRRLRLRSKLINHKPLEDNLVLVLGADQELGQELAAQFRKRGCRVVLAGLKSEASDSLPFYHCDFSQPRQLSRLAAEVNRDLGEPDIVIYAPKAPADSSTNRSPEDRLNEIANLVRHDLMEHFHVVSQFVPALARRSGRFVSVEMRGGPVGAFAGTGTAISSLAETLTHQMAPDGDPVHVTRVIRRVTRMGDLEDVHASAATILQAIEAGRANVTLPSATQHVKNIIRHVSSELFHIWNEKILKHWKIAR